LPLRVADIAREQLPNAGSAFPAAATIRDQDIGGVRGRQYRLLRRAVEAFGAR
jgi:hypothetical protein